MINFHPDDNVLAEYAAGSIDTGLGIAVKAHLSMCPKCRARVAELRQVGGMFLEKNGLTQYTNSDESVSFAKLMSRIKALKTDHQRECSSQQASIRKQRIELPPIVNKLLNQKGKIKWQFVSPSLKQASLPTGQGKYEVCLHRIRRGGKVAEHDHRGLEATVVLDGAFSDEQGTYRKGDFLLREPGQTHRPTATQDQDCLCLSVVEAPVKLTGFIGKIVNPFLRISPA